MNKHQVTYIHFYSFDNIACRVRYLDLHRGAISKLTNMHMCSLISKAGEFCEGYLKCMPLSNPFTVLLCAGALVALFYLETSVYEALRNVHHNVIKNKKTSLTQTHTDTYTHTHTHTPTHTHTHTHTT